MQLLILFFYGEWKPLLFCLLKFAHPHPVNEAGPDGNGSQSKTGTVLSVLLLFTYIYPAVIQYDATYDPYINVNDGSSKHLRPVAALKKFGKIYTEEQVVLKDNEKLGEKLEDLEYGTMYGKKGTEPLPYFLIVNIEAFGRTKEKRKYIKEKRKEMKMSQHDLAEQLANYGVNVSNAAISASIESLHSHITC
mgnify:CR=1 FL=1